MWEMGMSDQYLLALTAFVILTRLTEFEAAPVLAPDLSRCQENEDATCCPVAPATTPIKRFGPADVPTTLRVRKPAHLLDASEWEQLDRAYRLMGGLPADDPRSLDQQRRMHCAYCTRTIPLPWIDPTTDGEAALLDVHGSWMFLPWHRFFLYFHERILASLVGNESFALPYWNWDNQDEATLPGAIPAGYADPESALYRERRNANHAPPAIANLTKVPDNGEVGIQTNTAELREDNLAMMHHAMITGVSTKLLFFGQPLRSGDPAGSERASGGKGTLEDVPHDSVHSWIGNDMANPRTAAGDPIFFTHHTNVDRLWEVWKTMRQWRADIDDPDFHNTEFVFYDELAEAVVVTIGQGLFPERDLGYVYEEAPNNADSQWMTHIPRTCAPFASPQHLEEWVQTIPELNPAGYNLTFGSPVAIRMRRPAHLHPPRQKPGPPGPPEEVQEVLTVEATMEETGEPGLLSVFLLLPADFQESQSLKGCAEYAGDQADFSLTSATPLPDRALFRVALGSKLQQLGAANLTDIVLVLAAGPQHLEGTGLPVVVTNLAIVQEPVQV